MLFMCADGYRNGQNYGICRIEYAFGAGNKLRHSDLYSVRRDGIGTGYIELQLVQGDIQREDWVCVFTVHTADAESDADPHAHANTDTNPDADAYPNPYANAGSDSNAYADAGAQSGSRF